MSSFSLHIHHSITLRVFCITIVCSYHCKALFHQRKKWKTKVLKWKPHYALKYANAVDGSGGVGKKQKK
jgi:hypothetical protein